MTRGEQRYLVAHDYEMGGIWRYVLARSSDEVRHRFPELVVVDEEPDWMTDALRARLEGLVERLDDPPPDGLLATVLAERTSSD